MFKHPYSCLPLLLLLAACSHQPGTPLSLAAEQALPAVAAEYETTVTEADGPHPKSHSHRWRFWRSANRVETLDLANDTGEIWTKTPDGQIRYQQVFHKDQQTIEYLPGDLYAIGAMPDWSAVAMLVNVKAAQNQVSDGSETVLGKSAPVYRINDGHDNLEFAWLAVEQLPAGIIRNERGHLLETRLIALYPLAESPWPQSREEPYRSTDFADIGDKENDSFIKSILHKLKGGHDHEH